MAVDLLGPASAINAVTARPAQAVTYGAIRTWFKNCSSLTSADGTELTNDWLNNILAQLRTAFDGTGIVEDNGDDMLLRAMESIGIRYGTDIGAVNVLAVTFSPPVTALSLKLTLAVLVGTTNTQSATINPNGIGNIAITMPDGSPLIGGELSAGHIALFSFNGTSLDLLSVPPSAAIKNALFPYMRVINNTTCALASGVATALTGWGTPVGDPNIIAGWNATTGVFTCPVGYDGLYLFQSYGNTLTSEFVGTIPTNPIGFRMYRNGSGSSLPTRLISASQSPGGIIAHGTTVAYVNLVAGNTITNTVLTNEGSSINLQNFTFTAVRLGRST